MFEPKYNVGDIVRYTSPYSENAYALKIAWAGWSILGTDFFIPGIYYSGEGALILSEEPVPQIRKSSTGIWYVRQKHLEPLPDTFDARGFNEMLLSRAR